MKLLIIGTDAFSQQCLEIAMMNEEFTRIVFIGKRTDDKQVVGTLDDFKNNIEKYRNEYDVFFIGIDDKQRRLQLIEFGLEHNLPFCNLISNSSYISKSANLGKGILVSHGAIINSYAKIEDFSIIGIGSLIETNCTVNSNTILQAGTVLLNDDISIYSSKDQIMIPKNYCIFDE